MKNTAQAQTSPAQTIAADLQKSGDLIGAERVLRNALKEARAMGSSTSVAGAFAALGIFYQDIGRFTQAESSLTSSLKILRETKHQEDPILAPLIIHLAWLYIETGRARAAHRLLPQPWVDRFMASHPNSKYLPLLLETLGGLNAIDGRLTAATDIYRKNFDLLERRGADVSVEMASALSNFGFIELRAGRYRDAQNDFSKSVELWMQVSDPDDLQAAVARLGLAKTNFALRNYEDSAELLQQVLPIFERKCGPRSLRTQDVLIYYADVLRHQRRTDEAKTIEERVRLIRSAAAADLSFKQTINVRDMERAK
jgi:tetratricopeptide (TPR) repeat protein